MEWKHSESANLRQGTFNSSNLRSASLYIFELLSNPRWAACKYLPQW